MKFCLKTVLEAVFNWCKYIPAGGKDGRLYLKGLGQRCSTGYEEKTRISLSGCVAATLTYRLTWSKNNRLYYQLLDDWYKIIFRLYIHIGRNTEITFLAHVRQWVQVGTSFIGREEMSLRICVCDWKCMCWKKNQLKILKNQWKSVLGLKKNVPGSALEEINIIDVSAVQKAASANSVNFVSRERRVQTFSV